MNLRKQFVKSASRFYDRVIILTKASLILTILALSTLQNASSQSYTIGDTIFCPDGSLLYKKCNLKESFEERIPKNAYLIVISGEICSNNSMEWQMIMVQTFNGEAGFVNKNNCQTISDHQNNLAQNAKDYQNLIDRFGKSNADGILNHQFWIGMTDAMARASIGNPGKINKSVGSWGTHEQWVYGDRNLYLYFENGILTSYQQ